MLCRVGQLHPAIRRGEIIHHITATRRVDARQTLGKVGAVGSASTVEYTVGIAHGRRVGGKSGVDDYRAVGQAGQVIVHLEVTRREVLTQHFLTRVGERHQFLLVVVEVQARGLVNIVVDRNGCHVYGMDIAGVVLNQEIATHLRIGIEHTREVGSGGAVRHRIGNRATAVKTNLVAFTQHGDSLQVVGGTAVQHLTDAVTAVAVDLHLGRVVETHRTQFLIRDFIHTILRNRNLHPIAGGESGSGRIDRRVERMGSHRHTECHQCCAYELKFSQFAHISCL